MGDGAEGGLGIGLAQQRLGMGRGSRSTGEGRRRTDRSDDGNGRTRGGPIGRKRGRGAAEGVGGEEPAGVVDPMVGMTGSGDGCDDEVGSIMSRAAGGRPWTQRMAQRADLGLWHGVERRLDRSRGDAQRLTAVGIRGSLRSIEEQGGAWSHGWQDLAEVQRSCDGGSRIGGDDHGRRGPIVGSVEVGCGETTAGRGFGGDDFGRLAALGRSRRWSLKPVGEEGAMVAMSGGDRVEDLVKMGSQVGF